MEQWTKEYLDNKEKRKREEIIPKFEQIISNNSKKRVRL